MSIINTSDLVNPESGRTYREENLEKGHSIPLGALVELDDGVRLFVVMHGRDCDGTPLYWLAWVADPNARHKRGGFTKDSLTVISPPRP
jgi:hypothetical protein